MTMITPSYLGETIEYSSLHACRSTLEDPITESLEVPDDRLDAWATWALAEADRIDPSLNGRFSECFDAPD